MEEVSKFKRAASITDSVFKERGYDGFCVDLGSYLRTGNIDSFTSTDGARDMMKDVDVSALNEEVKKLLLKDAITLVGNVDCVRVLANRIPYVIDNWASRNIKEFNRNDTFDELYDMILSNPSLSRYIVSSIETAELNYDETKDKEYGPVVKEEIDFLEKQLEEIGIRSKHINR